MGDYVPAENISTWDRLQRMMNEANPPEPPEPNPWAHIYSPNPQGRTESEESLFMAMEDDSPPSPPAENPQDDVFGILESQIPAGHESSEGEPGYIPDSSDEDSDDVHRRLQRLNLGYTPESSDEEDLFQGHCGTSSPEEYYPPIPEGDEEEEEELPSRSENPVDHGIWVDPDHADPPTMTELEEWNRARMASEDESESSPETPERPVPENAVPDPELAIPAAVPVDWPLILQTVSDQMISGDPSDDDLADAVIGMVTDLYDEPDPLRIVYAEDLFVTPVEQEFQRLIAVEVLKAIRENKSREPPWQQALRRKPPRKQNNPKQELNNSPDRTISGLKQAPGPSLPVSMAGKGDDRAPKNISYKGARLLHANR